MGLLQLPISSGRKDDNTANNIANQVLAINKDSKMADEAFQLIEYITTGEYDKKMTEDALCIPTDKANSDAWPTELAGVKEAFDATTTFYDWAAGVESNMISHLCFRKIHRNLLQANWTQQDSSKQ